MKWAVIKKIYDDIDCIYGIFETEEEADEWADQHSFDRGGFYMARPIIIVKDGE